MGDLDLARNVASPDDIPLVNKVIAQREDAANIERLRRSGPALGTGGGPSGSASPVAASNSGDAILENARWESQYKYLSGETDFYCDKGGSLRR